MNQLSLTDDSENGQVICRQQRMFFKPHVHTVVNVVAMCVRATKFRVVLLFLLKKRINI